jgi:hypothetical protein
MMGVPYLFLDPEYLGEVSFVSLGILGFFFGAFTMAFHITCYILDGFRFRFIGHLKRPFPKFVINNGALPLAFILLYLYKFYYFQLDNSNQSEGEIWFEMLGFLTGVSVSFLFTHFYFLLTHKDIFRYLANNVNETLLKNPVQRVNVISDISDSKKTKYRVDYYLDLTGIKKVNSDFKYDRATLLKVFDQNHLNALILQLIAFISILVMGFFKEVDFVQIPASASVLLLFSITMMFTGAFSFWFRGWSISGFIVLMVVFNFLMVKNIIKSEYQANGMNYKVAAAEYNLGNLYTLTNDVNYLNDIKNTEEMLNNWRSKFPPNKKPKMILLGVSGGGQRAASWTFSTLQFLDSCTNKNFFKHTSFIAGASGGVIGASYYREMYLRSLSDTTIKLWDNRYYQNITKDMLNPVIFGFVASDLFFKTDLSKDSNTFCKDRGYALEQTLNRNTELVLDKKLMDYALPEYNGKIPMLLMAPTILNDGRKLYIASQPVSYMTSLSINNKLTIPQNIKGVEFNRFFEKQNAKNLNILTALRMNASFPYVTPNISLPSEPRLQVMDAGLADNFGFTDAVRFLFVFRKWISENTSGVVFVSIRDTDKQVSIEKNASNPSIMDKIFNPIGSILINWAEIQDFKNDDFLEYAKTIYKGKMSVINFEYIPKSVYWAQLKNDNLEIVRLEEKKNAQRAALSWHLTQKEKESIKHTIYAARNQASLKRLMQIMNEE